MAADRDQEVLVRVQADPDFANLVEQRHMLSWCLSALMLAIYFGFILMIAFAPALLGAPMGSGVTTIGIPIGVLVIIAAFVLTGFYVHRANSAFDPALEKIIERAKK